MVSTIPRITDLAQTAEQRRAIELIESLDLEPIVYKLTVSEQGKAPKMTLEEADRNVALYRQFLILTLLYSNQPIVPTEPLDEVWHTHILDTRKYDEDCRVVFGRMLHHFPYLGLRGEQDVANWQAAFVVTQELFETAFGVKLLGNNQACGNDCGANLCEPQTCTGNACSNGSVLASQERPRPDRRQLIA